MNPLTKTKT